MSTERFTIGIDFGTESGRVMLVRVDDGTEAAYTIVAYPHGVLDRTLPDGTPLGHEWALQHPGDYEEVLRTGIPRVLRDAQVAPEQVVGIGVDFTSCTILPTLQDGTPLCLLPQYSGQPHAWVKLWKHHASQPQANRINDIGPRLAPDWMRVYGGKVSSEWLFSKVLQILDESPAIFHAADRILEAGDWIVWRMTGVETRNECAAGYKGMWVKGLGYPPGELLSALHPELPGVLGKLSDTFAPLGARAGGLTPEMASATGLLPGTPVAVASVDAHAAVPACGVTEPGALVMIMGTSLCHMLLAHERQFVEGVAGVIEDGIIPGYWGYEAGQAAVGDLYAWFFRCFDIPADRITEQAGCLAPGASGLIALDWWNGNRSVLMDADLSGLLIGMTLQTQPAEIYRALIEATAFGTYTVIQAFENQGVPITSLVACGGLPQKSPLVMQIFADVTNRSITLPAALQASGLGAAMQAAVAAGIYQDMGEAASRMVAPAVSAYDPNPKAHTIYRELYKEYCQLHDYFGRDMRALMQRLRNVRSSAAGT